jgi:TPR repeat protein
METRGVMKPKVASEGEAGSDPKRPDSAPPFVAPRWMRFPFSPLALSVLLLAFVACPRVHGNPRLVWTYVGVSALLIAWTVILGMRAKQQGRELRVDRPLILRSHYIQACVQTSVYLYWGWYWRDVYWEAPLIVSQMVFLVALDALLSWSRGRDWRPGFGPLPIIFSTNLFIWFKDDVYAWQFALVAVGALGKEFIKWKREGRMTHIFNPSAFTLALFSVVLIATNTTHYTWGIEIAATLARPPHIYIWIFCIGLIVQYFFAVTLMTLSAVVALVALNLAYTGLTDTYMFVDENIPIAIFLGLHLLVTDPSTSPRSNLGRVIFGLLYGVANFVLYHVFEGVGIPEFYDKLLPVPVLNLSVQLIDRYTNVGIVGRISRWEGHFKPRRANLVYMSCWIAFFVTMIGTGYLEAPHKGASIAFWKQAYEEGKPNAGKKLYKLVGARVEQGLPAAHNELGVMHMEGDLAKKDRAAAGHYFASACASGDLCGCANVATQFLFLREARSLDDVNHALTVLEQECTKGSSGRHYFLLGYAYEMGWGRPIDQPRAYALYKEGAGRGNLEASKSLARLLLPAQHAPDDLKLATPILERGCGNNDAESCMYLGYIYSLGKGAPRDDNLSRARLEKACSLGSEQACQALQQPTLLPFTATRPPLPPAWCGSTRTMVAATTTPSSM